MPYTVKHECRTCGAIHPRKYATKEELRRAFKRGWLVTGQSGSLLTGTCYTIEDDPFSTKFLVATEDMMKNHFEDELNKWRSYP